MRSLVADLLEPAPSPTEQAHARVAQSLDEACVREALRRDRLLRKPAERDEQVKSRLAHRVFGNRDQRFLIARRARI